MPDKTPIMKAADYAQLRFGQGGSDQRVLEAMERPPPKAQQTQPEPRLAGGSHTPRFFCIELPWPPTGNHYKKPSGKFWYLTKSAIKFHKETNKRWTEAGEPKFGTARLQVCIVAYPPDRRRRDIDNLTKVVLDSLQRTGLYADDCQVDDLRIQRGELKRGGCVVVGVQEVIDASG